MFNITINSISKSFSQKQVIENISFKIESGTISALLGENGAGKSTLATIIAGSQKADKGTIEIESSVSKKDSSVNKKVFQLAFSSPNEAQKNGISIVHQNPYIASEISIWENIVLGAETKKFGIFTAKKEMVSSVLELLKYWNINLNIKKKAKNITGAERFYIAFLSAIYKKPKLLILDEPSASLDKNERDSFFYQLEKAKKNGLAILFVTHNIQEAIDYADSIYVLKKGVKTNITNTADSLNGTHSTNTKNSLNGTHSTNTADSLNSAHSTNTKDSLNSTHFVNNQRGQLYSFKKPYVQESITNELFDSNYLPIQFINTKTVQQKVFNANNDSAFLVTNITANPAESSRISNISFRLDPGKITCIAGSRESGIETLENIISGMYKGKYSGSIKINNQVIKHLTPNKLRALGVSIIPFNKTYRGSNPELTVKEILCSNWKHEQSIIDSINIDTELNELVSNLSGGMLQRLILARELYGNIKWIIMSSPTYGLDKKSAQILTESIKTIATLGIGVLVFSISENEIEKESDTLYSLLSGELKLIH